MNPHNAKLIAINGAKYIDRLISPSGRFYYGFDSATMEQLDGYNSLRHSGSIWALLEVHYHSTADNWPYMDETLKAVIKSLEYYRDTFIKEWDGYTVSVESKWIKLGSNGLAALAFYRCYHMTRLMDPDVDTLWMLTLAKDLCKYIKHCFDDEEGMFTFYKRHFKTGKESPHQCSFYPGEALLALAKIDNAKFTKKVIKAYFKHHRKVGFIRDHWMMQAIEATTYKIGDNKTFQKYANGIVKTNWESKSKKAGPTACRSECILAYLRYISYIRRNDNLGASIRLLQKQLRFQAESIIKHGMCQGAFTEKPNNTIARNDMTQHNISSFLGWYCYQEDIKYGEY